MPNAYDQNKPSSAPGADRSPLRNLLDFESITDTANREGGKINGLFDGLAKLFGLTGVLDLLDGTQDGTFDPGAVIANFFNTLLKPLSFFQNILGIFGVEDLDGDGIDFGDIWHQVASVFLNPLGFFANLIGGLIPGFQIPGLDASKIVSGSIPQAIIGGLTGALNTLTGGIQGAVNGIVNSLQGLTGGYWTQAEANAALQAQAAATAAAAAALAQLQANNNQSNTGGVNVFVDFSTFTNSANLPAPPFVETYIGGSIGAYGVASGLAQTTTNENSYAYREFFGEYSIKDTDTDYQRIGAVWTGQPGVSWQNPTPFFTPFPWYGPYTAFQTLYCRYKDVNNWVRVRFVASGTGLPPSAATLECCVGGTTTTFVAVNHDFQPNTAYWLEAGTPGGINVYRVICGTTPIITYTDASLVAQIGAAFRGGTIGGSILGVQGVGYPVTAAPMLGFSLSDNQLATRLGKQIRLYCTTSPGVPNASNVPTMFPNGTLDVVDYNSGGIFTHASTPNNRITVSEKGTYEFILRVSLSNGALWTGCLWKNGVLQKFGGLGNWGSLSVWNVDLAAGDYVNLGGFTSAASNLSGDAAGNAVYVEVRQILGVL
jgi:hypothetical protein